MTATELGEAIGRAILRLLDRDAKPCEGCDDEALGLVKEVDD